MEYLKNYGITNDEIQKLEDRYNEGIINFIKKNEIFIINTIEYLYSENIKCIFLLMMNNIKIFLETQVALKEKVEKMKRQGLTRKEIQMRLLQERN